MSTDLGEHWAVSERHADLIAEGLDNLSGFVYRVVNQETREFYFGRKAFWSKRIKYEQTKTGNKRRRHYWVASDWRTYYTSSDRVTQAIAEEGLDNFLFEVLGVFKSKSGVAVAEATLVLGTGCLFVPDSCYNRQAPAIRGYVKMPAEDVAEVRRLSWWISNFNQTVNPFYTGEYYYD